jgi:reductive dehalogenase
MAVDVKAEGLEEAGAHAPEQNGNPSAPTNRPPLPPLGRSVHVVGELTSVDYRQTPHPKNSRGELGLPMYNWYVNSISHDPLGRIASDRHSADTRNVVLTPVGKAKKGAVNPEKTPISDPKAMSKHIKRVAKFIGFDVVGIANVHPSFVYKGGRYNPDGGLLAGSDKDAIEPETIAKTFPYAIVACVAWDYDMGKAHRHRIGDAAYHFSQQEAHLLYQTLAGYIRELGYNVALGAGIPMPLAVAAGIGEMGRNGMVITEKFGSRIHMPDVILTDMPLAADKPIDLGVPDFCSYCRKCAITCPTNSIPFEGKVTHNGIEKFKINWLTCYRLRPHADEHWEVCLTCATICPYSKPVSWWHAAAIQTLRTTPKPLRQVAVRPLKWLDDKVWGRIPNKRVKWLGYDSGVAPGEKACMISGCNAHQDEEEQRKALGKGEIGFYFPLRENTRRFESKAQREAAR